MRAGSGDFKDSKFDLVMKLIGIIMSLVYVIAGALVITNSSALFNVPTSYAFAVGSLLVVYGLFRGYRVYTKYFKP